MYDFLKETDNIVNKVDGGYDHVTEFIPIAQPTADTLAKLTTLQASNVSGDRSSSHFPYMKRT